MSKKDGLDVDRPERFLAHERIVQSVGVVVMSLFALAGAAGAFGNGPLSDTTIRANGIEVQYERFARSTFRTQIEVTVDTSAADGQIVRLRLAGEFLKRISMLEVRPPDAQKASDEQSAIFEVPASRGKARLELHYEPERFGILRTPVAVDGAGTTSIWQLIYF